MSSFLKKFKSLYSEKPVSVKKAMEFQKLLSEKVVKKNSRTKIYSIAGADLSILKDQKKLICGIIVFTYPGLEIVEKAYTVSEEKFPYIPGLLSFREGPALIETFMKLKNKPDMMMLDGQGIAHPRHFGIACHIGVLLDIPAVGVAKKKLYGNYSEPGKKRGSIADLKDGNTGETIGAVLRTRDDVKPVFVSIGNKIDLKSAVNIVNNCSTGYRVPEPTRQADKYVAQLKQEFKI